MTRTFKEAFYFFRHNLAQLSFYTLAVGLVTVFLPQLLNSIFFGSSIAVEGSQESIQPFTQIANLLIQPIYAGGLILLIFSLAQGQIKGIFECLMAGIMRWPYMFLGNLITSLMIIGGLMLFVVPGIWLFTRLFLVPFLIMLKNQPPFEAITNSFQYTKGYSFTILRDMILLIVLFIAIILIFQLLQILHPVILLLLLLIFQTMANVLYYRHYEILVTESNADLDKEDKLELQ